jgi:hypothetical protein
VAVETEELVLKSNVASIAARDAAALNKLLAASDKINATTLTGNLYKQEQLRGVKAVTAELAKQDSISAKINNFDAGRAKKSADLAKSLKKLNDDATGKTAENEAKSAAKEKVRITKELGAEQKAQERAAKSAESERKKATRDAATEKKKADGEEKTARGIKDAAAKKSAEEEKKNGESVREGARKGAAALAGLFVSGLIVTAKVGLKIAEMAIEQTTFRETSQRALDRLTKGQGAATYDIAVNAAVHLGMDKETTVAQTKALLQAGISKETIPIALKAIADVSVDLGDEKGNALKEQLGKIARKSKFDAASVDGLAEAGVKAADVFEALKKKGESTTQVMARLKTNQVSAAEGIKAVLAAVEKTSGGAADATKTIPGLLNAIGIRFAGLFDKIDTGPLKDVLKTVLELFEGTKGDALKKELTGLGDALFGLLKPLTTAEGKKALGEGFDKAAAAAHDLAIIVSALGRGLDMVGKSGGFDLLLKTVEVLLGPLQTAADLIKVINGGASGLGGDTIAAAAPPVASSFDISAAANDNDAADVGGNMAKGVAKGVDDNAGAIGDSMVSAVNAAVQRAEAALGIASPAKRLVTTGKWSALGMAKGWNDNAGAVADAASGTAQMAASAAGGASGAGATASGGGGAGPQVNITVVIQGGKDPQATAQATAEAIGPIVRREIRAWQRDAAESGGSASSKVA